jgi:uncharacterized protein with GYD domain
VVEGLIKSLGGTVEAYYYAFGDTDLYIISEGADNATVAAGILAVVATGTAEVKTTVLLTTEEIDEAAKKTTQYRPPAK